MSKGGNTPNHGMIFLSPEHPIVRDTVKKNLEHYINEPGKDGARALPPMNLKIADFDGVVYQVIVDSSSKDKMQLNLFMNGYKEVSTAGGDAAIRSIYGQYLTGGPKNNSDLTLEINAGSIAAPNVESIATLFGLLKRNVLGAPLEIAFKALSGGNTSGVRPCVLSVRPSEQIVIVPANDRVNVAISFHMDEATDAAFTEQILRTMAIASQKSNGPNVKFSKDLPAEVSSVSGVNSSCNVGFLLFSVTKAHVKGPNMDNVISLLLEVRHYVHYHVKASKAHLHQRMRAKVQDFLQVLNRARPEQVKQKKKFRVINF